MSLCGHDNTTVRANRTGPTNAGQIEEAFVEEVRNRFERLKDLLIATIEENNALRLQTANAEDREAFDFPTREGVTQAFIRWLQGAIRDEILEPLEPGEVRDGQHWTATYLRTALIAGVNQSTGLLFQNGMSVENIPDEEIPDRPIYANTLMELYQRTYEQLKSVTEDMVPVIREELTRGFAEGVGPREMARNITDEVTDLQRTRAETIARSETINAHSESSLRNYEQAGVSVVSHGTWNSAEDTRTCPFCRRLEGTPLTFDEMRSGAVQWRGQVYRLMPPAHPNGRCNIRPAIGASRPTSTLRSRLDESFEAFSILSGG